MSTQEKFEKKKRNFAYKLVRIGIRLKRNVNIYTFNQSFIVLLRMPKYFKKVLSYFVQKKLGLKRILTAQNEH